MDTGDPGAPDGDCRRGTALDCSEDRYRGFFEFVESDGPVERAIREFLGPRCDGRVVRVPHGFEIDLPIQMVPEFVGSMVRRNIGIYQIPRRHRGGGPACWHPARGSVRPGRRSDRDAHGRPLGRARARGAAQGGARLCAFDCPRVSPYQAPVQQPGERPQ